MNTMDYIMRGGNNPNPRGEMIELQIAERALKEFLHNPLYAKKGLKWTYNWIHFLTLYATSNPDLLKYLHEVRPYPSYIEVETTTACDMKCTMCENTHWKEKAEHMSLKKFTEVLDQFPKLKWIGVAGIGQSFLNIDFMEIIQLCKARDIYVEGFDNFMYLDYDRSKLMVDWGIDKIYCSLDAATKETYEKVRINSDWEKTMQNLKDFDRAKKEKNSYWPELWFHFIVSKYNIHELKSYLDMIDELDIDVKQVQFTRCLHNFKEIEDQFVEISDQLKNEIIAYGRDKGIKVSWNVNAQENKAKMSNCSLWTMPFIFVDGTVVNCCSQNEQNDRPFQRENSLGNIFETPMREIWYGENYKKMLEGISSHNPVKCCERCVIYDKRKK